MPIRGFGEAGFDDSELQQRIAERQETIAARQAAQAAQTPQSGTDGGESTVPTEPMPGDTPPEKAPKPPKPPMPEPAGKGTTTATPLGAGTFQLPGSVGAAPFRTADFLRNRFVAGSGAASDIGPLGRGIAPVAGGGPGMPPGGDISAPAGPGGEEQLPLDPELLRQLYARILGGR